MEGGDEGRPGVEVFDALIDAADRARIGVVVIAVDGSDPQVVYANGALAEMLGCGAASMRGQAAWRYFADEETPRMRAMYDDRTRGASAPTVLETVLLRSDGTTVPVQLSTTAVDLEGRPANVAFVMDIRERKAQLDRLVHADKMAAVGTLAAGVAHEINNPLAYLLLNLEILARELPRVAEDPSRLAAVMERLREAQQGAQRVKTIVADLQVFTRTDQGIRGPVDLAAAVTRAAQIARHEIRQRAALTLSLRDIAPVYGNATRFEQVFLNLLINANAAFASPDPDRNRIHVELRALDSQRVTATVTDNGSGMSEEVLRRAFEPFFTTKAGVGTGLGLAICHGIVQAAGGTMRLHSREGEGTTVTVTLPVAPAPESASR